MRARTAAEPLDATAKCRGERREEGRGLAWTMRRDDGCGERDSRSVEGQQGHDPGGTIDADGLRPLDKNGAVTSRCNRNL